MSILISLGSYARHDIPTEVFRQYELLSTLHGQLSADICCGFYNKINFPFIYCCENFAFVGVKLHYLF